MRQFLEALLLFQLGTCRLSPINKIIPKKIEMSHEKRSRKFLIFSALFTALFAFQIFSFARSKEQNYYELLGLESSNVSPEIIEARFENLTAEFSPKLNPDADVAYFKKINAAYKCLKALDCRNEYTRFGSGIQLNDPSQDFQFDWRLGFTVAFYIVFAFVQGTLASVEQKPGLRIGTGVGIMFCMTEVQLLQEWKSNLLQGTQLNPGIETIMGVFPATYCAFEIITMLRIVFFWLFNIVCSNSLCFEQDENKLKTYYGAKL